jgi:hypothetical protein
LVQNINQQKSTKINILVVFCLATVPKQQKPTKINKSPQKQYTDICVRSPKKTNQPHLLFEINKNKHKSTKAKFGGRCHTNLGHWCYRQNEKWCTLERVELHLTCSTNVTRCVLVHCYIARTMGTHPEPTKNNNK